MGYGRPQNGGERGSGEVGGAEFVVGAGLGGSRRVRAAVIVGAEPLGLDPLPLRFFVVELAHHLVGEQLHRRADVLVANVPALAQEHHLVDAGVGVATHELAHL